MHYCKILHKKQGKFYKIQAKLVVSFVSSSKKRLNKTLRGNMTTALERLNQIMEYVGITSVTSFSKGINIKPTNFQSIKKGLQKSFSYDSAYAINRFFPEINIHWIMTGEGEMLLEKSNTLLRRDVIPEELQKELDNYGMRLQEVQIKNKIYDDAKFAKILGISEKRYAEMVSRNKLPSMDELVSIINNFNVSADWLLFGIGNKNDTRNNEQILTIDELAYLNKIIEKLNQLF